MTDYRRFAIYFIPKTGSSLQKFGDKWLDIVQPNAFPSKDKIKRTNWIKIPKKYGFHGTLKAPFRLRSDKNLDDLIISSKNICKSIKPFSLSGLKLSIIENALALTLINNSSSMSALSNQFVIQLDKFRAPLSKEEISVKRSRNLTAKQDYNLLHWGYPYVMEQFYFHLTLTNTLDEENLNLAKEILREELTEDCLAPQTVDEVGLVGEQINGDFKIITRLSLTG